MRRWGLAFGFTTLAASLFVDGAAWAQDTSSAPREQPTRPEEPPPTAAGGLGPTLPEASFKVGASRRSFVTLSNTAMLLSIEGGVHLPKNNVALHFTAGYEVGRTDTGLSSGIMHVGVQPMATFGPVRVGPALELVWYRVFRATTGEAVGQVALSAALVASLDLLRFSNHGVFVDARVDYTSFRTLNWGLTGSLGVRF